MLVDGRKFEMSVAQAEGIEENFETKAPVKEIKRNNRSVIIVDLPVTILIPLDNVQRKNLFVTSAESRVILQKYAIRLNKKIITGSEI